MDESYKTKLLTNLPPGLKIFSSMDYPEQGIAKIRGVCSKCGWTLEWHYLEDPDYIHIETTCLDQTGIDGNIRLEDIKDYLS
jgi:hypothetical protein